MFGWIIKMLLKVMKPFAKQMIWEAIFDFVENYEFEDETAPAVEDTTAAEPTE